jgi:pimeloyl-ACP methyl ester carboxylesterase
LTVVTATDHWWVATDGLRLHATVRRGPDHAVPMVCLPGLTRNGRDFEGLAAALATARTVVAADLRGRGGSDRDPSGASYTPEVYASDVLALLGSLGFARVHLIGTSLGGMVAQIVAAQAPGRVVSIVLNDVGPELAAEGLARIRSYAGLPASARSWTDAAAAIRGTLGDVLPGLTDDEWQVIAHRMWRDDGHGTIVPDYDPAVTAGLHATDPTVAPPTAWPLFEAAARAAPGAEGAADRPLLLLRGALSDLLAPATVAAMRQRAPHLRVDEVPDRGHAPTLDEPASRAAIAAFLADQP